MNEDADTTRGDLFDKAGILSGQSGEMLQYLDRIESALDRIRPEEEDPPEKLESGKTVAQENTLWQKINNTIHTQDVALGQAADIVRRLELLV